MAGSTSGWESNPPSDTTLTSIFQVSLVPNNLARPPVLWTPDEVKTWVEFCIQEFCLPQICLDKFNINGKALLILTKADFLERAPEAGDVLYNVFQRLSQSKDSKGKMPPQHRPSTSFVPILPHPSSSGIVNKEDNPSSLQDVPASMLSPAPTEKYSSDSDSCPNDVGSSPPSVDMDIDSQTQKADHHYAYLHPQEASHKPPNNHPETSEGRLLWEFIYQLLEDKEYKDVLSWESEPNFTFCIKKSNKLAELWGSQKNRTNMTYEKLSRALRYYYKMGIIQKVPGKKLTYQFLQHPTLIRRGQRGARPHSQRNCSCDEDKVLNTGFINNICSGLPTKTPVANPSNLLKARSLSPASPSLALLDGSLPIQPVDEESFKRNDYAIIGRSSDAGKESKMEVTVSEMSSSETERVKLEENVNKQEGKEPFLPFQSFDKEWKTRKRPSSCPLDHSYHSHEFFSSNLIKKPESQPVSPRYHSDISRHLSIVPFSSETEFLINKKLEGRETSLKTMPHVECSEKPGGAAVEVDFDHTMQSSFVNDSNKTQLSFYDAHSSPHGKINGYDYIAASPSDQRHFLSPIQENTDKVNFLDRQIQHGSSSSGFSSYNQSFNNGEILQCNSTTVSTNPPNNYNIHKAFKESNVPISCGLYNNNLHLVSSNCTSCIPLSSHKIMQPLNEVPYTYITSMCEPNDHLYQPYPVHKRAATSIPQLNCQSHGIKPVIQNLPESIATNGTQNSGNGHYRPEVMSEYGVKTFKPDSNFLLSRNSESNNNTCPVMKDGSNFTSSNDPNKNYVIHGNTNYLSFPQDSSFKMNLPQSVNNSSMDFQPDCSSNNDEYVKFQGYRTEQEQPEDLSISVKT